jgi:hypothetical protein
LYPLGYSLLGLPGVGKYITRSDQANENELWGRYPKLGLPPGSIKKDCVILNQYELGHNFIKPVIYPQIKLDREGFGLRPLAFGLWSLEDRGHGF